MKKRQPTQHDITEAALEALIERHGGRIGPRVLLDEARDPRSPFHDFFEWDDGDAAEHYRLIQASQLIRRWKGTIIRIDAETRTLKIDDVRRVQSPSSGRGKGLDSYETVEQIMANPDKRENMLQTVLAELAAYRRRYAELSELAEIWAGIDEALELYGRRRSDGSTSHPDDDRPQA